MVKWMGGNQEKKSSFEECLAGMRCYDRCFSHRTGTCNLESLTY